MDLFDTVSSDIKAAMLARDKVRLEALRGIKKEFLEAKSAPGAAGGLSDDAAMKILVKMAKQRRESNPASVQTRTEWQPQRPPQKPRTRTACKDIREQGEGEEVLQPFRRGD